MSIIRVLHVIDHLGLGGAQSYLSDMIRSSHKLDRSIQHEIIALYAPPTHLARFRQEMEGLPCVVNATAKSRWELGSILTGTIKRQARGDYDVLHLHLPVSSFLGSLVAKLAKAIRTVCSVYAMEVQLGPIPTQQVRLAAKLSDRVVVMSRESEAELLSLGVPKDRVVVVPLGVDFSRASPSPNRDTRERLCLEWGFSAERTLILAIARLSRDRHSDVLAEAIVRLARARPDLAIVIVGDGELRPWLEDEIQRHNLDGSIYLVGSRPDKWDLYPSCDIYVAISYGCKNLGMAHLEAMSCARPMVTRSLPWCTLPDDQIECTEEGKFLTTRSDEAFVRAVSELIGDPERRRTLGEEARRMTLNQSSIDNATRLLIDLYYHLCPR